MADQKALITDKTINRRKALCWCIFMDSDPSKIKAEMKKMQQEKKELNAQVSESADFEKIFEGTEETKGISGKALEWLWYDFLKGQKEGINAESSSFASEEKITGMTPFDAYTVDNLPGRDKPEAKKKAARKNQLQNFWEQVTEVDLDDEELLKMAGLKNPKEDPRWSSYSDDKKKRIIDKTLRRLKDWKTSKKGIKYRDSLLKDLDKSQIMKWLEAAWEFLGKKLAPYVQTIKNALMKAAITTACIYLLYKASPYIFAQFVRLGNFIMKDGTKIAKMKFAANGRSYICEYDLRREAWVLNYASGFRKTFSRKENLYPKADECKQFFEETKAFADFRDGCKKKIEPFLADPSWLEASSAAFKDGKSKENKQLGKFLKLLNEHADGIKDNMFSGFYEVTGAAAEE